MTACRDCVQGDVLLNLALTLILILTLTLTLTLTPNL